MPSIYTLQCCPITFFIILQKLTILYFSLFSFVYYKLFSFKSMTTAHRPTWKSAFGLADSINKGYTPTRSYSARDLPGYLNLKQRQWGQGSVDQLKEKDFKAELLKRQKQVKIKKIGGVEIINAIEQKAQQQVDLIQDHEPAIKKKIKRPQDHQEQQILDLGPNPFPEDEDSQSFIKQDNQKPHHRRIASDDQDDSDDDDSELLRQYEKIKEQREKEELFKRQQKHQESLRNREKQLLKGNPLIDSSYSLKKRWYEDTVFRNQAKKVEQKKSYVNDYVRSQFHRKFMQRFVGR